jgi:hypothetical protein
MLSVWNIFHPQDPVAFRLEPLYYHNQVQMDPEVIPYWVNNGLRSNKQWARSYEYAKGLAHQKWMALKSALWDSLGTTDKADKTRLQWETNFLYGSGSSASEPQNEPTDNNVRIDCALQEQALESYVESLGLLQSHFCYWTSRDVALFMLKKMSKHETAAMNSEERADREAASAVNNDHCHAAPDASPVAPESVFRPRQSGAASGYEVASRVARLLPGMPAGNDIVRALGGVPCVGARSSECGSPRRSMNSAETRRSAAGETLRSITHLAETSQLAGDESMTIKRTGATDLN